MSTGPTPIAGAGASAEPSSPSIELENVEIPPSTEVQEPDATTEVTEPGQQPPVEGEGQPPKEDGRVIPQWMRELQNSNPEAFRRAKTDFFDLRDRRTLHPTVQAARQEHDLIQSLGGQKGIDSMREDMTFFKDAAQQFLKGDPAFVQDLWEEDPIAAALHVAPMLETFKQKDFEGYRTTVAKLWQKDLQDVGFGGAIQTLIDLVKKGDKENALRILSGKDSISEWYQSILNTAQRAEDPRVKTLLAERARQRDSEQKTQHDEFLKSYKTEAINTVVDEGAKVFDSFFKGKKVDAEDRTDLLREVLSIADRIVKADTAFMERRDRHLELGDSHSAMQLTKARYAREFPNAVKRVARRYGLISGTPSGTAPGQKPPQGNQPPPAEKGWVAVNQRPDAMEIDHSRTSREMIFSGKAILKDGRKVDWTALKKKELST